MAIHKNLEKQNLYSHPQRYHLAKMVSGIVKNILLIRLAFINLIWSTWTELAR